MMPPLGSDTVFFLVGPTNVKACKSFLSMKNPLEFVKKEHLFDFVAKLNSQLSRSGWCAEPLTPTKTTSN